MEALADAVPHERPHHPEAVALAVRLHRVGDVAQAVAGPALHDRLVEALARHVEQLLDPRRHRAHRQRDRAVRIVALDDAAQIEPDDVALAQLALGRRDAVHHFLVDRDADGGRVAAVALEGRARPAGDDECLHVRVDLLGGDAGLHESPQAVLHLGQHPPRGPHVGQLTRRLEEDHRGTGSLTALRIRSATCSIAPSPATRTRRPRRR